MDGIEKFNPQYQPIRRDDQPPWFTQAGALDRRHGTEQVVRMHDVQRDAQYEAALELKQAFVAVARMEGVSRVATEAKYKLHRATMETRLLAGEDPVLQAHFAGIDDTLGLIFKSEIADWVR